MRFLPLIFLASTTALLTAATSCSCGDGQAERARRVMTLDLREDTCNGRWHAKGDENGPVERIATEWKGGRLDEVFNDSNHQHWRRAAPIGIEPLGSMRSHWQLRRPLVKITSCEDFYIEPLTFSRPFLVAEAADALHEIGRRFRQTVKERGGGDYRIRVTSVLRTASAVKRLRRRNSNAVDSSVHQLGTTFDVSYNVFMPDPGSKIHNAGQLKTILSEILLDMRSEGRILVKYEKKQPCFHISAIATEKQ